jgi:hypothetical protein
VAAAGTTILVSEEQTCPDRKHSARDRVSAAVAMSMSSRITAVDQLRADRAQEPGPFGMSQPRPGAAVERPPCGLDPPSPGRLRADTRSAAGTRG